MRNYFANGCCGLTPRGGSLIAGVYMILVCTMHIVFEHGHLRNAKGNLNFTSPSTQQEAVLDVVLCLFYVTNALLGMTMLMSVVLLISVRRQLYKGLLVYVGWIIFYECASIIVIVLKSYEMGTVKQRLNKLEWVGLGLRLALHFFFMVYVITYALQLMESRGRPLIRRRKVTRGKEKTKTRNAPPALKFSIKEEA